MAKAKYKRYSDGYYRTRAWDGTYNPDGSKHRINLKSDKSSKDLERLVNLKEKSKKEKLFSQLNGLFVSMPDNGLPLTKQ